MSNAGETWRVAVVGGGLSGLAAAHRLGELCAAARRPLALTLFEAGPRVGGLIETREIGGYRAELGADSFITNKPWGIELCRRLGLENRLIPTDPRFRRSLVLRKGRPVAVPEGFQLLTPVQIWPVLTSSIFSPWGKLRMGLEYFLPRRKTAGDESLASFVRRRFGRETLERLVQPLVGGIYTSDPEKLSLEATLPRFLEMEQTHGSLIRALRHEAAQSAQGERASGARYGLFITFMGGVSELLTTLAQRISERAEVRLNSPIAALAADPVTGGFRLTLRDKTSCAPLHSLESRPVAEVLSQPQKAPGSADFDCDAVVLALPAYRVAELVEKFSPELAAPLQEIEYASTAIVVSGHKLSDIRHPLDAFGLVVPTIERRKILAVSFTSRKFPDRAPEGHVQLRTFVGGALQPELFALPDAEILALVRSELAAIFGVTGEPDFAHVARYPRAMPQYHLGHIERIRKIEDIAQQFPRLALAGNAYHGVGIPDSIHSGEQAAERLFKLPYGTATSKAVVRQS